MGMSASQARLLNLQARQSNLEYQGQQINQERTILSQQSTALYNSLLAMNVPTPPSTSDFTTIEYSGVDGATTFSLGTIKPNGDNTYNVTLQRTQAGHYIGSAGTAKITDVPATIIVSPVEGYGKVSDTSYAVPSENSGSVADGTPLFIPNSSSEISDEKEYYEMKSDKDGNKYFVSVTAEEARSVEAENLYVKDKAVNEVKGSDGAVTTEANYDPKTAYAVPDQTSTYTSGGISKSEIGNCYIQVGNEVRGVTSDDYEQLSDGTYALKSDVEGTLVQKSSNGTEVTNPDSEDPNITKYVEGNACTTMANAKEALGSSYTSYLEAIRNAFPEYSDKDKISDSTLATMFYVYFTKSEGSSIQTPHFISQENIDNTSDIGKNSYVEVYDYSPNGNYTTSEEKNYCQLTFDTSGRITEIKIPTNYENDVPTGYKTISLTAETVTDNAAYQDAYNEYEYAQYEYDKKQQEINAKTSIIQQEDRNLELKLQRLDNERTQITTEIEAVDKVINDNIESSYKTFSG